jgi:hypothetical protein
MDLCLSLAVYISRERDASEKMMSVVHEWAGLLGGRMVQKGDPASCRHLRRAQRGRHLIVGDLLTTAAAGLTLGFTIDL